MTNGHLDSIFAGINSETLSDLLNITGLLPSTGSTTVHEITVNEKLCMTQCPRAHLEANEANQNLSSLL